MSPIPTTGSEVYPEGFKPIHNYRSDSAEQSIMRGVLHNRNFFLQFPSLDILNTNRFCVEKNTLMKNTVLAGYIKNFSAEHFDDPHQTPVMSEYIKLFQFIDLRNILRQQLELRVYRPYLKIMGKWELPKEGNCCNRIKFSPGAKREYEYIAQTGTFDPWDLRIGDQTVEMDDMIFLFPDKLNLEVLSQALESGLPTPVALNELSGS
jgi:hypothetical protein